MSNILIAGKVNNIDARAIAGAISWEYERNVKGRYSDYFQTFISTENNGMGWGSIHETAAREIYHCCSDDELKRLRMEAPSAITMVAKIMKKDAMNYFRLSGGIWMNDNPILLAYFFNTGRVEISALKNILNECSDNLANGRPVLTVYINEMANWLKQNIKKFCMFKTFPELPNYFFVRPLDT